METRPEVQVKVQQFANGLRRARRQAGDPSYRPLSKQTGYSISSISRMLSGKSFPRWEITAKFLRACNVSEQDINGRWRSRWITLAELVSPLSGDMPADDEDEEAPAGAECDQCGAWVNSPLQHQAWHTAYVRRDTARASRHPLTPEGTGTGHPPRSLPG